MELYSRYTGLKREDFTSYEDLRQRYKLTIPDNFNFAFDVVDEYARLTPDALAMRWVSAEGEKIDFTFRDMSEMSNRCANFYRELGVRKGDRVLLVLKRGYQFWYAFLGLHKVGAIAIPATNLLTPKDYVYRCNAAGIKLLLITGEDNCVENVCEALPECTTVEACASTFGKVPEGWLDFDKEVARQSPVFERPTGEEGTVKEDPMLLYFTSGTTGYPKMVWHDHTYALGHLLTGVFWHWVEEGGLHFTISDTGWGKAIWGKMYGQWLGGSAVFTYDFHRFHADDILRKMEQYHVTTFCAPPTMYRYMIQEDLSKYDLSSLKHCTTAGEALNPEVYNQWLQKVGLPIYEGFGQTETTLCVYTAYPFVKPRLGSMGLPSPGWDLVIVDPDGKELAPGVTGEICVKADREKGIKPNGLFGGYFRNEALTAEAWHNGLYHTGDTAYKDEEGFLWYVGRIDDVIKSSGYRIGPFEVESALMEHPAVVECAVTGVPDDIRGFIVKATIVLAQGYEPSEALTKELQNHVKRVTAPYKYPRLVEYVDELPKTISGKIRRVEIRENDLAKMKKK
ncbi:MAG: AMP-binding protein [Clostridia bacterium]|nr:AMP-binding protein [Clostridia bacterium]